MANRILIIDSDISLSTVLADYLESRGYEARRVSDAKTGIAALAEGVWDLVLMELQGIGINGYELQPGLYLYSLVIDGQEIDTKRMILSK